MKVEYEFDRAKIRELGYSYEKIVAAIKRIHADKNLPCLSDGKILAFCDSGSRCDYSNLWINMDRLVNSSWFLKCATAMRWFDENDDEVFEDVLAQADKLMH